MGPASLMGAPLDFPRSPAESTSSRTEVWLQCPETRWNTFCRPTVTLQHEVCGQLLFTSFAQVLSAALDRGACMTDTLEPPKGAFLGNTR